MICAISNSYKTHKHKSEPKHKLHVSAKQYREILTLFFEKLAYYLITSGERILLPARLGAIQMLRYKSKRKSIDFKKTKEYYGEENKKLKRGEKKVVFHNNRITEGFKTRMFWFKLNIATFKHQRSWSLNLSRPNIRKNTYNKNHAAVTVVDFFKEKGWYFYKESYFDNHEMKIR